MRPLGLWVGILAGELVAVSAILIYPSLGSAMTMMVYYLSHAISALLLVFVRRSGKNKLQINSLLDVCLISGGSWVDVSECMNATHSDFLSGEVEDPTEYSLASPAAKSISITNGVTWLGLMSAVLIRAVTGAANPFLGTGIVFSLLLVALLANDDDLVPAASKKVTITPEGIALRSWLKVSSVRPWPEIVVICTRSPSGYFVEFLADGKQLWKKDLSEEGKNLVFAAWNTNSYAEVGTTNLFFPASQTQAAP